MLHSLVEHIVKKGIPVTIGFEKEMGVFFDINTEMKSGAKLVFVENGYTIHTRYDKPEFVAVDKDNLDDAFSDLCWRVKDCMCGRDFLSEHWERVLLEGNYLKKEVTTKTTKYQ